MHGVFNAIVLTTFFAVMFGHYTVVHYLKKEPPKWSYLISLVAMVLGTVIDLVVMVLGKASALYTFYAPLKASPLFYMGTALLIVGSWIAFAGWIISPATLTVYSLACCILVIAAAKKASLFSAHGQKQ
jgi:cytochrome c oxidase subunit 1